MEFIYPRELEIKETTETAASSSYLYCYLYIDNGKLTTRLYDKRDDVNIPIVNFPFLSNDIPSAPAQRRLRFTVNPLCQSLFKLSGLHGAWESAHYKVVEPGYQKTKLVATLKKFYGRHHDLVNPYNVAVSRIVSDGFANEEP